MTDIKTTLSEEGAGGCVGAGAIASVAMPLHSDIIKRPLHTSYKVTKNKKHSKKTKHKYSVKESMKQALREAGMDAIVNPQAPLGSSRKNVAGDFDAEGVLSKLKSAERKESIDKRNTTTFGLEDSEGRIVRVCVPVDQADNFEQVLQQLVSQNDDNRPQELAELLFDLKNQFTFVDIEWPEIEENEEEPTENTDDNLDLGLDADKKGEEVDMDFSLDAPPASDTSGMDEVKGLLTKVIDMMKSDAEARRREAIAREKEAEVRAGEAAVNQALAKVKQEEQILDMEIYNKKQKDEAKEAKRLAQLARWKHDMEKEGELDLEDMEEISPMDTKRTAPISHEEEEVVTKKLKTSLPKKMSKVTPSDVASFIVKRMK